MAVKLTIAIECVDWERARKLMDGMLGVIEDGMQGGDQTKLGFVRATDMGRRKRETKDTFTWVYGEARPELAELGFERGELPIDTLLRGGSRSATINSGQSKDALSAFRKVLDKDDDEEEV